MYNNTYKIHKTTKNRTSNSILPCNIPFLYRIYPQCTSEALDIREETEENSNSLCILKSTGGHNVSRCALSPRPCIIRWKSRLSGVCACRCWISVINYPSNSRVIGGPGRMSAKHWGEKRWTLA